MYTDPEGKFGVVFWTCVVLGVGIGMIGGYSIGRSNGLTGWDLFGATIGGGIVGGLLGAAGGYFIEALLLGGGASGLSIGALSGGGFGLALSNGYTIATATVQTLSIATAGVIGLELIMSYQHKPVAPRIKNNSRKEAYDKAFFKGGKKPPILHNGDYGTHYHPANLKFKHWHYYFALLANLTSHNKYCNCPICKMLW